MCDRTSSLSLSNIFHFYPSPSASFEIQAYELTDHFGQEKTPKQIPNKKNPHLKGLKECWNPMWQETIVLGVLVLDLSITVTLYHSSVHLYLALHVCISNELLKSKAISLFLIRIWILRMAYSRIYTWSWFWSCKSLWSDLGSVAFPGWMEPCFFWALFCVGFIIMCLLLSKSFSNTKDKFCPWDISICQK